MSENVQFEADSYQRKPYLTSVEGGGSGMAGWLIRHKLAKDSKSADMLMVCIIIIDVVAIVLILKFFS